MTFDEAVGRLVAVVADTIHVDAIREAETCRWMHGPVLVELHRSGDGFALRMLKDGELRGEAAYAVDSADVDIAGKAIVLEFRKDGPPAATRPPV